MQGSLPYSLQKDDYLITVVPLHDTSGAVDGLSIQVRDMDYERVETGKALKEITEMVKDGPKPFPELIKVLDSFVAQAKRRLERQEVES